MSDLWPETLLLCSRCQQNMIAVKHYVTYCEICGGGLAGIPRCVPEFEHESWCPAKEAA